MKTNSNKSIRMAEARASRTAQRKGDYVQCRVRIHRTNEDISNDISEGMPVTPEEVLRVLKWERQNTQKNQNRINGLRDALVKVGLMLVSVEKYTPRCHEIFKVISDALKYPNAAHKPSGDNPR